MWNYSDVSNNDGGWWNDRPLDQQLEILKKYYPIGMVLHHIQPNSSDPASKKYYKQYNCTITGYRQLGDRMATGANWYILEITNDDNLVIECRRSKHEAIHPGFFTPNIGYIREYKLLEILEKNHNDY